MLVIPVALVHIFVGPVDPVIWAGALVGQGCYSGGRSIANSIAGTGKIAEYVHRNGARKAAQAQ